jgi:hypothetical protein
METGYYHFFGHTIKVSDEGVFVNKIKDERDGTPAKKEDYIRFNNSSEAHAYIDSLYNYGSAKIQMKGIIQQS